MRTHHAETLLLDEADNAGNQMIVAAIELTDNSRHQTQRHPVEAELMDGGPHDRADEDHVAAALLARGAHDVTHLTDAHPVMRVALDRLGIGEADAAQTEPRGGLAGSAHRQRQKESFPRRK